jgi:hypothetical protein
MMKSLRNIRILFGLLMAIVFGVVSYFGVRAGSSYQGEHQAGEACQACHPALHLSWQESAHGQALVDPIFQEEWELQDNPRECLICHTTGYDAETNTWIEDGITCQACHGPIPDDHPKEPMPTDRSAELCEKCHSQTVFEWKISMHRQTGLDCVDCHGQHSTTLRADDAAALCASCHRERASNFAHSSHSREELSCPDCHLETLDEDPALVGGHPANDHSFRPKLNACNECHSYQMHDPVEVHSESGMEGIGNPDEAEPLRQGISVEPNPVNPVSFALLSALIGMAAGLLLAPWIQEWYHKIEFSIGSDKDSQGEI